MRYKYKYKMSIFSDFATGFKEGFSDRDNRINERTNEKTESVHSMIKESNYEVKIRWLRESTVYVRANKPTQVATIRYEGMPSSNYGLYDSRGNKLGHIECSPRCFTITGFQTSMSYIDIVGWGNEAKLVAGNMYAPIIRFDKGRYHIFSNRGRVGSIEFGNMLSAHHIYFDVLADELDIMCFYTALKYLEDWEEYKRTRASRGMMTD